MPRLTEPYLRATARASSTRARVPGQVGDVAFGAVDELQDLADLLLGGGGCAYSFVGAADGGQPFPGSLQVIEAGGQVGQEETLNAGRGRADAYGNVPPERAAQVIALQ